MPNQVEQWFNSIPIITRLYLTLSVITAVVVTFELLTPFQIYLNWGKVWYFNEYWRIVSTFLYFDRFGINLIILMYLLYTYSRRLEEHNFHGKSGDFLYLLILGIIALLLISPLVNLPFLSNSLLMMIVYVWSRKNPYEQLRIYGLFVVSANWISYLMMLLTFMFGQNPLHEFLGIIIGHIYIFGNVVLKRKYKITLFKTPKILSYWLNEDNIIDDGDEEIEIQQRDLNEDM